MRAFGSLSSSFSHHLSSWIPSSRQSLTRLTLPWLGLALAICGNGASAQTKTVTSTILTVTAGSGVVTTVGAGTVVTLTASVKAGSTALTTGQVDFCDATAKYCTDIHVLGMAQLTSAGTATLKFRPGIGSHSYKAVFLGTNTYGGSMSSAVALIVTGKHATASAITQNYDPGYYTLTATVSGIIDAPGIPAPTGSVSFVDTSNSNSVLGTATVSSGTAGLSLSGSLSPVTVPAGMGIATADFNGDGIPDLAVGAMNGNTGALSILLGNGDGTFIAVTPNPAVGNYPASVVAADFNGDGIPDLAVGNVDDSTVSILLGKGDGTFTAKPNLTIGNSPQSLAIGDFNGDGIPDLAVVAGTSVLIYIGNGDGTFQSPGTLSAGSSPQGIAVGDLNGDGIADLVVANDVPSGSVTVFLGNGDGTFKAGFQISGTGDGTISVAIADFNGDGIPDLALTNYSSTDGDSVSILLGKGNATFQTPVSYSVSLINLQSVVASDFNGDGVADLAIGSGYASVAILPGNGDGTFGSPVYADVSSLYPSGFIAVADYNGDGLPDIAEPNQISPNVAVFLDQQNQTVTASINNVNSVGAGQQQVVAQYPGDSNYLGSTSSPTPLTSVVAVPAISLASGSYSSEETVTITDATPGATIYYSAYGIVSTNGSVPYTGSIQLSEGGTEEIFAYATETGYQQSNETYAAYTLNLPLAPAPAFSVSTGTYSGAQSVTITDAVSNATIYYTTNGTTPTTASTQYTGPVAVSASETLAAVAIAPGYSLSPATSGEYVISSVGSPFIDTVAGTDGFGYAGDGGQATAALLNEPADIAVDGAGNLYIADSNNNVIRKVAAGTEIITTVAGNNLPGYGGDGGPAENAEFEDPNSVAVDAAGDIYIADPAVCVIRKVSGSTGDISTYAGNGSCVSDTGDNGPATSAGFEYPSGLAIDASGNLYIADLFGGRVRKVAVSTGTITTYAGGGSGAGGTGSGGPATNASLSEPQGLVFDSSGNLYIADSSGNVVWKVSATTQIITIVAGNGYGANLGSGGYTGDGGPATSAELHEPTAVTVDKSGNLYITDAFNQVIREVTASTSIINTVFGNGNTCYGLSGDGGPAGSAFLCNPQGLAIDASGNLYIADQSASRVRVVTTGATPTKSTAAPAFSASGGTYSEPQSVALTDATPGAAIYVTYNGTPASTLNDQYRSAIDVNGSVTLSAVAVAPGFLPSAPVAATYSLSTPPPAVVSTVAGRGSGIGPPIGGQPATNTYFTTIDGVAVDRAGNLYIPDSYDAVVWEVSASTGIANIVAGTLGSAGYTGDGGPATSAHLSSPEYVALDSSGNIYISDSGDRVVWQVNSATGVIETYAGSYIHSGSSLGDGGPATAALIYPTGLAFDSANNLYVADEQNDRVREVTASTGIISTVAGGAAYNAPLGDGGPATAARLLNPFAVTLDPQGDLYIADNGDARVRLVNAATGIISTIAGNGDRGSSGDGLPATQAEVSPLSLALDAAGDLYIADGTAVRELAAGSNVLATVGGNGYSAYDGDGRSATLTGFCDPNGLAFDASGNLLVSDYCNVRVRKLTFSNTAAAPTFSVAAGTYASGQSVEISDATQGAIIYYTTDGTAPTTHSSVYSAAIAVDQSETLKAMAAAGGYADSSIAAATYTIAVVTPTVTVTPSLTNITTAQSLSVAVAVSAGSENPTPTGTVTLTSGSYTSVATTLASGAATVVIPAGSLSAGTDALTASYTPDTAGAANYNSATGTASVNVAKITPAMSVTPAATSIKTTQSLSVTIAVGGGSGNPMPTGTVTLASGSYTSAATTLASGAATIVIPAGSLSGGTDTLTATYSPDAAGAATYNGATSTASVTVAKVTPTLTVEPAASGITTAQSLSVTVAISGGSGNPTPTGSVTLAGGSYSAQQTLASGSARFSIAAGALPVGSDKLTATYTPDSGSSGTYTTAGQSTTISVTTPIGTAVATVTVTPGVTNLTNAQTLPVTVAVSGASGQPTPTGSATLSVGTWSNQQNLSSGGAKFTVPAGTLSTGSNTLTAAYSGDTNYAIASSTTTVTVSPVVSSGQTPSAISPGSSATSTITFSAGTTYSGTMNLTCALTASPNGAQSVPTCSMNPTSITLATGGKGTSTLTVQTTASSTTAWSHPIGAPLRWLGGGGATLAAVLLFGIPARRRRWASMFALSLAVLAFGTLGCGGGGSGGGGGGGHTILATTAGDYTFTVTGTDSANAQITASTTVVVTVQ